MCSGTCTTEKKEYQLKNHTFFSLASVWSAIFHKYFCFTTVSGSESKLFSDSDPAKTYRFFRIHNTTSYDVRVHLLGGGAQQAEPRHAAGDNQRGEECFQPDSTQRGTGTTVFLKGQFHEIVSEISPWSSSLGLNLWFPARFYSKRYRYHYKYS
jgi:hypothetical protein